ncbi:MAG: alpha/beta hydrolase [Planctomycetota bacterium]|nr:alpha/beta hydrolase [Planctomycetota bacterium]
MISPFSSQAKGACVDFDIDHVLEMGDGPRTVLLLHGLFGTPEHWRIVMESMAPRYHVLAPQLPVDPQPGRRQRGIRKISDLSKTIVDLVEERDLGPLVICGNSLGGLVALDICINRPDFAKGLVLAGSAGLFEKSPMRGLNSRPSREFVRSTVTEILHKDELVTEELVDEWHRAVSDRDYARFILRVSRATRDRSVEHELDSLQLPTLIIWGANDEITPPSTAEEFHRRIPNAQLEFIDECGHAPSWEQPEEFARLLENFLPSCFAE